MDTSEINGQIALCAAWQCHVRRNCRRYVEFASLRHGEGAGRYYVAMSGRKGDKCPGYKPMDVKSTENKRIINNK